MNYQQLWRTLAQHYEEGEAKAMARMVYEVRYGLSLSDILLGKDTQLSANNQKEVEEIAHRLLLSEPIQYVLGIAEFCGRTFIVTPDVLIPRPETEELCRQIISKGWQQKILDIGTGSGCIAITLAAEMPHSIVTAWDISEDALSIAEENAKRNNVDVSFQLVDMLHLPSDICRYTSAFDLIVSNPPYICYKERADMEKNVLDYEPPTALFVPDNDPLLFYKAIARFAGKTLTPDGMLAVEINRAYGQETCEVMKNAGFNDIQLFQDSYHNDRFVIAKK